MAIRCLDNKAKKIDMKKAFSLLFFVVVGTFSAAAQSVVLKHNVLLDVVHSPNLSLELGLNKKQTLDLQVGFNPLTYNVADNSKFRHLTVQPEWRYWFCERFNGWFVGAHAHAGRFNAGNVAMPFDLFHTVKDSRYEGWFAGAGVGVGYQLPLSRRFSLEAEIGAGYAYVDYDKFACGKCGTLAKDGNSNYWGVTRAGLSLVYVLK